MIVEIIYCHDNQKEKSRGRGIKVREGTKTSFDIGGKKEKMKTYCFCGQNV
jgi:hypothetical protein